jgi:hypothetical protein
MGKYRGQWLWAKWQSTVAGTDLLAWNGAKSPNWSTTIPMLALHEVETPPTPPKPIHMVSGVMLVKGYSMRQQSAVVVSEYLPSFKTTRKSKSTHREEWPTMSLLSIIQETSVKYSEPSCNVYGVSTYGNSFGRNDNLASLGPIYLTSFNSPSQARRPPSMIRTMWTATWLCAYQGGSSFLLL